MSPVCFPLLEFLQNSRKYIPEVPMENYVVRIYRRDDEQKDIAGIVEVVGTQQQKPFKTHEELLAILNMAKAGATIVWETK
jgi:hypothetical protein